MPKASYLTIEEKAQIRAYNDDGHSSRYIGRKIGRSHTVVCNYIRDKENYGKNYKPRLNMVTTPQDRRAILRAASNSTLSVRRIKGKIGLKASKSTILRIIRKADYLKHLKIKKKTPLNESRRNQRLSFAKQQIRWDREWHQVVFSDEKKFNLDGPDGYNFYFHDMRKEEIVMDRRHSKGGGVMVWGAVSYYGTVELDFQSSRMTAETYKCILGRAFPKLNELFGGHRWVFQQDNAPIHTARLTKAWIQGQNVDLLPWPPYSPDLNIMENVWGWLSRKVYEGGRQFETKEELVETIKSSWSEISLDYLSSLYDSMHRRLLEVIENSGGSTHY